MTTPVSSRCFIIHDNIFMIQDLHMFISLNKDLQCFRHFHSTSNLIGKSISLTKKAFLVFMVWHKVAHLCKITRLRVACYLFFACKMHLYVGMYVAVLYAHSCSKSCIKSHSKTGNKKEISSLLRCREISIPRPFLVTNTVLVDLVPAPTDH